MLSRAALQLCSIVQLAVVARFLLPADYGLMAIVLLVLNVLDAFTTPGFTQALIQRQGPVDEYFPSVFTVGFLRGVFLFVAIAVLSPTIASFFHQTDASLVVMSAGVIVLLRSLQSPALVHLHRNLHFRSYFYWDVAATGISFLAAVILAPTLQNVWALLIAIILGELARTVGSYIVTPWRPRLAFHLGQVRELNRFGRWVMAGGIVTFLSLQLDNIIVGRMLGATQLGYYEVAFRISQLPATQMSYVTALVAFPALSQVANQMERFRTVYLKMTAIVWFLNLLMAIVLIGGAGILATALGPQWRPIVALLQILALAGFVRSIFAVGGKVFYALGMPHLDFVMNAIRLVVFVAVFYPLAHSDGSKGVAIAVLIAVSSVLPVYFWLIARFVSVKPREHMVSAFSLYPRLLALTKRGAT